MSSETNFKLDTRLQHLYDMGMVGNGSVLVECPGNRDSSRQGESDTINEGKIVLAPNERSVAAIVSEAKEREKRPRKKVGS